MRKTSGPAAEQAQLVVRESVAGGAILDSPYLVMNALATLVASYGLLANSAAVVIGAMIIATLLGPIMGLALAIVDGDVKLLQRALVAEAVGAVVVLAIAIVIGRIHSDLPLTDQILARTKPNLLDLMVALGGGAAGAYATVSPRVSVGLVGVAISTALLPPLATCGICLARGLPQLAGGAAILFITNLVAIQCSSSVVLFAFGYHHLTKRQKSYPAYFWRIAVDAVLLLGLAVFLFTQLSSEISQQSFESGVKGALEQGLEKVPGAFLADVRFRAVGNTDVVVAVVRVPNSITPKETAALQGELPKRGSRTIELHVRSLLTKEATAEGYMHVIEPDAPPVDDLSAPSTPTPTPLVDPSASGSPSQTGQPGTTTGGSPAQSSATGSTAGGTQGQTTATGTTTSGDQPRTSASNSPAGSSQPSGGSPKNPTGKP